MSIKNESFDSLDLESRDQFPDHPHGKIAKSPKAHYGKGDPKYFQADQSLSNIDGVDNSAEKAKRKAKIKSLRIEKKIIEVEIDLFRKALARKQRDEEHDKELNRKAFIDHKEALDLEMESVELKTKIVQADLNKAKQTKDSEKIGSLERELQDLAGRKADIDSRRKKEAEEYHKNENERKRIAKAGVQDELQKQIQLETRRVEIERELDELQANDHLVLRDYTPLTSVNQKKNKKAHAKKAKKVRSHTEHEDQTSQNTNKIRENEKQTMKNVVGVILAIVFIVLIAVLLRVFIHSRPAPTSASVPASPLENSAYVPPPATDYFDEDFDGEYDDQFAYNAAVRPIVITRPLVTNSQTPVAENPQVLELMTSTVGNNGNPATSSNVDTSFNNKINTVVKQNNQITDTETHRNGVNLLGSASGNGAAYYDTSPPGMNNYNYPVEETSSLDINTFEDKSKNVSAESIENVDMSDKNTNFLNQDQTSNSLYMPLDINRQNGSAQLDAGLTPQDNEQPAEVSQDEQEGEKSDQNNNDIGLREDQNNNTALAENEDLNLNLRNDNILEPQKDAIEASDQTNPSASLDESSFNDYLKELQNKVQEKDNSAGTYIPLTKETPENTENDTNYAATLGQTQVSSDSNLPENENANNYSRIKDFEEFEETSPSGQNSSSVIKKTEEPSSTQSNPTQDDTQSDPSINTGETEIKSSPPTEETDKIEPKNSLLDVQKPDEKDIRQRIRLLSAQKLF